MTPQAEQSFGGTFRQETHIQGRESPGNLAMATGGIRAPVRILEEMVTEDPRGSSVAHPATVQRQRKWGSEWDFVSGEFWTLGSEE